MINVELTDLGYNSKVQDYKLSKTLDEFGVVVEVDSNVKFENPANATLLELTGKGFTEEPAIITVNCGGEEITYDAFIYHNEGKFNLKHCYAEKPIKFKSVYDCIKDLTINIFDYTPIGLSTIQGDLQRDLYGSQKYIYLGTEDVPYTLDQILSALGGIPDRTFAGWAIEHIRVSCVPEYIEQQGSGGEYEEYTGHDCQLVVTYVRAFSNTQLDSSWIELSPGAWYLNPSLFAAYEWNTPNFNTFAIREFPTTNYYVQSEWTAGRYQLYKDVQISNTYSVNEITEAIFECSGITLVSNFFGINTDGTEPNNNEYDFATTNLQALRIIQSFDVIRESALQDSFGNSGTLNAKKFITDFNKLFGLQLVYDSINDVIRWEHYTYFNLKGIDYTVNSYEYEVNEEFEVNKDLVNLETWTMAAETPTDGFYSTQIDYKNYQLTTEINDVQTKIEQLLTDVIGCLNNEAYEGDNYKKLFFIVAASNDSIIGLNNSLSLRNLIRNLHMNNRPLKQGNHDGVNTQFSGYSIGMSGELKWFTGIKQFNKLNPGNSVKTQYGRFVIEEMEYEKETLTLKIKR